MTRLMSRQELQNLRSVCQKAMSLETKKILVCGGTGCVAGKELYGGVMKGKVHALLHVDYVKEGDGPWTGACAP